MDFPCICGHFDDMHRGNVSRVIADAIADGLILRTGVRRKYLYELNPTPDVIAPDAPRRNSRVRKPKPVWPMVSSVFDIGLQP